MDNLKNIVELEAQNTVGYSEAVNKESFMIGVSVAFSKTEEQFLIELESTKKLLESYISMYEDVSNDMKTLTGIIGKYSDNDKDW